PIRGKRRVGKSRVALGTFDTAVEAAVAYARAVAEEAAAPAGPAAPASGPAQAATVGTVVAPTESQAGLASAASVVGQEGMAGAEAEGGEEGEAAAGLVTESEGYRLHLSSRGGGPRKLKTDGKSSTGYLGVFRREDCGRLKFVAQVSLHDGHRMRLTYLGVFPTAVKAAVAVAKAKLRSSSGGPSAAVQVGLVPTAPPRRAPLAAEAEGLRLHLSSRSNNTGYKGVYKDGSRFKARDRVDGRRGRVDGKTVSLGTFDTAVEAAVAYAWGVGQAPVQGSAAAGSEALDSDEGEGEGEEGEARCLWVACDRCDRWRRLPAETPGPLPAKWFCWMHPDPARRQCEAPEDEWEEDSVAADAAEDGLEEGAGAAEAVAEPMDEEDEAAGEAYWVDAEVDEEATEGEATDEEAEAADGDVVAAEAAEAAGAEGAEGAAGAADRVRTAKRPYEPPEGPPPKHRSAVAPPSVPTRRLTDAKLVGLPAGLCGQYQQGLCHKGGKCKWRHELWPGLQERLRMAKRPLEPFEGPPPKRRSDAARGPPSSASLSSSSSSSAAAAAESAPPHAPAEAAVLLCGNTHECNCGAFGCILPAGHGGPHDFTLPAKRARCEERPFDPDVEAAAALGSQGRLQSPELGAAEAALLAKLLAVAARLKDEGSPEATAVHWRPRATQATFAGDYYAFRLAEPARHYRSRIELIKALEAGLT
ncbi:hypothetical protein EMIHUDRAFT_123683, partial [Emiliania huxleyi CCMP1516]|uniref:CW-type domain-containing protein n=3 Tax=Emiliania huxleyi TaxID=2903 RepID=A0A0D3JJ19_EMIH1